MRAVLGVCLACRGTGLRLHQFGVLLPARCPVCWGDGRTGRRSGLTPVRRCRRCGGPFQDPRKLVQGRWWTLCRWCRVHVGSDPTGAAGTEPTGERESDPEIRKPARRP